MECIECDRLLGRRLVPRVSTRERGMEEASVGRGEGLEEGDTHLSMKDGRFLMALGRLDMASYVILYCTVLYCTVLYCTVLYCTVLYCIVL